MFATTPGLMHYWGSNPCMLDNHSNSSYIPQTSMIGIMRVTHYTEAIWIWWWKRAREETRQKAREKVREGGRSGQASSMEQLNSVAFLLTTVAISYLE